MPISGYPSWVPAEKNKLEGGSWITLLELIYSDYGAYAATVLGDAPIGYWRLDEVAGTNANDSSPYDNDGTYVNTPTLNVTGLLTGDTNAAVTLNGTDEVVRIPNSMIASRPKTIEIWFKGSAGNGCLFGIQNAQYPSVPTEFVPILYVDSNNKLRAAIWNGTTALYVVSTPSVNDNVRHHAVMVIDETSFSLYLDGSLVGTTSGTMDFATSRPNHQFGAGYTSASFANLTPAASYVEYNGTIDEIAIYDTVLIPSTITKHWQAGSIGPSILRLAKWSQNVSWNGQTWTVWPIGDITPNQNIEGELPTTSIPIAGLTSFIISILENFTIEGKKGNIYMVHADHLGDATPVKKMPFTIINVSVPNWDTVVFNVIMAQAAFEPLRAQLPLKLVTRDEFPGVMGSRITV